MSNERDVSEELIQCSLCLRRMRPDVFLKHPNVCLKNPTNKRNVQVFDMAKYRSVKSGDKTLPVCKIPSNNNDNNRTIIRPSQTRSAKRDRRSDTFVPPIIENFYCPTCKRTFCEKAYDRHVAFCSSKNKQIPQPPSEEILLARLKLDRRIKFAPNRQSKPNVNLLPLHKPPPMSLAHCPWCSKPYFPKSTHFCRNVNYSFLINHL